MIELGRMLSIVVLLFFPISMSLKVPFKGILVDWSMKMFHQDVVDMDVAAILDSTTGELFILRERLKDLRDLNIDNPDSSGLSLVLNYACDHDACKAVKAKQECQDLGADDSAYIKKLVLRRETDITKWRIDCRRFLRVELPLEIGGSPGARIADDGRDDRGGNLETGPELSFINSLDIDSITTTQKPIEVPNVETVTIPTLTVVSSTNVSSNATKEHSLTRAECNELITKDFETFYMKCCLGMLTNRASLSDTRCLLSNIYQMMKAIEVTTAKPVVKDPFAEEDISGLVRTFAPDISHLGRSFDNEETEENDYDIKDGNYSKSETDEVLLQDFSGETDGWKSKYFTILGFFLVFLLLFLVVIAVLVYRLRKNKTITPPASPGVASLGVPPPQRTRGYSALEDHQDEEEERAPLTPATQQAQSFQY